MAASVKSVRSALQKANRINDVLLPQFENLKQRKLGKSAVAVFVDYKTVFVDFFTGARRKPWKTTFSLGLLGGMYFVYRNNTDEDSYRDTLLDNANDLLQIGRRIRNPKSDAYIQETLKLHYQGRLKRLSLGLFSLMLETDLGKECDLYEKHCYYTKPRWIYLWKDVRDVGVLGHWYQLEMAMTDFDVNEDEMTGLTDDLSEQNTLTKKVMRYGTQCLDSIQEWVYSLSWMQTKEISS